MKLLDFLQKENAKALLESFETPLFAPNIEAHRQDMEVLAAENRPAFPAQVEQAILPVKTSLEEYGAALVSGEMGIGKTQIGISSSHLYVNSLEKKNNKVLFLTAGSKHLSPMAGEIEAILGDQVDVKIVKTEANIVEMLESSPEKLTYYVMSKDLNKVTGVKTVSPKWGVRCHNCGNLAIPKKFEAAFTDALKEDGEVFGRLSRGALSQVSSFKKPLIKCPHCEEKMVSTTASGKKPKRSIAQRLRKWRRGQSKKMFDVLIADEVHQYQSNASLQTDTFREAVRVSGATIALTGTLSNGYASSIFYILQAILPQYMKDNGYPFKEGLLSFIQDFGTTKETTSQRITYAGLSRPQVSISEAPVISERIVGLLAPFTAWVKMADLNLKMPSYTEEAIFVEMEQEVQERFEAFRVASVQMINSIESPNEIKKFGKKYGYMLNNPTKPYTTEVTYETEVMHDDGTFEVVEKTQSVSFEPFESERRFEKEIALIDRLKKSLEIGRSAIVYSIFNRAGEISSRLKYVLDNDLPSNTVVELLPESVKSEDILSWIESHPCDVLIASPSRLAEGLNLPQFPDIHFYETGTNLRTLQQAARRSWRASGTTKPVKVYFYAYQGVQAAIVDLMAKKMKSAAKIEGSMIEEGQLAHELDDDLDVTEALNAVAREIELLTEPDFADSNVKEGTLRPMTVMEKAYADMVSQNHENIVFDDVKEEPVKEKIEDIVAEVEEFYTVETPVLTVTTKEEETVFNKIETKSGLTQLTFSF